MENEAKPLDYAMLYAQCLQAAATFYSSPGTGTTSDIVNLADGYFVKAIETGREAYAADAEDRKRRGVTS
jgi:hypothetical protein